jgi:hypothetical protein
VRRLLLVLALLAVGCSANADAPVTATTVTPTTITVPVSIEASHVCGPMDGPAVRVEVTGVDARLVDLELQAVGRPAVVVPYAAARNSMSADAWFGGPVTAVRIREPDGPILAEDRDLDEDLGGGCG